MAYRNRQLVWREVVTLHDGGALSAQLQEGLEEGKVHASSLRFQGTTPAGLSINVSHSPDAWAAILSIAGKIDAAIAFVQGDAECAARLAAADAEYTQRVAALASVRETLGAKYDDVVLALAAQRDAQQDAARDAATRGASTWAPLERHR